MGLRMRNFTSFPWYHWHGDSHDNEPCLMVQIFYLHQYIDIAFHGKCSTASIYRHHFSMQNCKHPPYTDITIQAQTTNIRVLMLRTACIIGVLRFSGQSASIYRHHFSRKMLNCLDIPIPLFLQNSKHPPYTDITIQAKPHISVFLCPELHISSTFWDSRVNLTPYIDTMPNCLHIPTPLFLQNSKHHPYTDITFHTKPHISIFLCPEPHISSAFWDFRVNLSPYIDTTFHGKYPTASIYRHRYPGQTTNIRILMPRTAYIISVLRFSGQSESIYRYHFSRKMPICL